MNMPGFTAALSLAKTAHRKTAYRHVSDQLGAVNRGVPVVVPSLFIATHAPDCPFPCRVINNWCVCPFG
jgi:hypothetical protein